MWQNNITDEVFETMEEAVDAIIDELENYQEELYQVISDYSDIWIFDHLTPDAQDKIYQRWLDKVVDSYLSECDDE